MAAPPARTDISAPYPNPSNALARIGFGKLWDYATGLLGTTGNPPEARAALGFGPGISGRQRLINSQFLINQRGVSTTVTLAAGAFGHDRWKAGASGCTYSTTVVGSDVQINITAGSLMQIVEGANIEGGDYVLSWVGTAQGRIGVGPYSASGVTSLAVVSGINVAIEFRAGTVRIPQLEPGIIITPYERRLFSEELVACQRYYENGSGVIAGYAGAVGGTPYVAPVYFKVGKRAIPTLSYTIATSVNNSVADIRNASVNGAQWHCEPTNVGNFIWSGAWTASAEL